MKIDTRSYISYVLIGDDFKISKKLREFAYKEGMDVAYDLTLRIVDMFLDFDNKNLHNSAYENLRNFIEDNEEQLFKMIEGDS